MVSVEIYGDGGTIVIAGLGELAELALAFAALVKGRGLIDRVGLQTKIAGPAVNAGVVVAAGTCGHTQVVEHTTARARVAFKVAQPRFDLTGHVL
jgi:hypothetical protein